MKTEKHPAMLQEKGGVEVIVVLSQVTTLLLHIEKAWKIKTNVASTSGDW